MLEIKSHSETLFSIKSTYGDVTINDPLWDFIFDFHKNSLEFYFIGNRLQVDSPDIARDSGFLSEDVLFTEYDYFNLLLKIKKGNLFFGRNLLDKFWNYYEYPAIIFSGGTAGEHSLVDLAKGRESYDKFVRSHSHISIIYRSFELDVLWIAQSPVSPRLFN